MKKLFLTLLCTMVLGSMLVACSPSTPEATPESETDEPTAEVTEKTITVWAWDPNFNIAIMNEAAARYNEEHPDVTVVVEEMAKADVEQKLHTTLAAQTTNGLPEIVLIEDYNAQKYLNSYPGNFADLTNEVNYNDFAEYKVDLMTVDGKVYGVPFDSGVAGMFYRTDILAEAGYTEDDMMNITWDEFIEIGKDVKEKTGKYMLGFQTTDGGIMRIMLQSAGEWYFDEDGMPALADSEALAESMRLYKEIVEADIAKPTAGWNEWVGAINSGDAATITTGVWIVGSVKAAEDQSGLWAVAPSPRLSTPSTSVNASNLGGSSWYVLENSENKDIAIDFMKTMYAGDLDFYDQIMTDKGAMATYLPAAGTDAYGAAQEFFADAAIYEDLANLVNQIPSVNYGEYTYEADAAVMAQMEAYVNGDISLEDAIANAQAQLELQVK